MNFNKKIANNLSEISKLNPFENSRKREIIEIRSALIKILREYQEMTLNEIARFFINNNRYMDHSTVLHSLKNYEIYIKYNPKLKKWHDFIVDSLFESGDYNESFIVKRKILKDRIDCLNKKNLDELLLYSKALASEQAR
jgi:hypothetical protein|tara:strand:- start:202 stop:621 length:420 start_codon:yes stop_codon:yes gene_type:complete